MDDLLDRLDAPLGGRYRVLNEIGRGGMARVYLADDLRLERQVAVKIMRPDVAASVGRDRFFREIDLTAHLSHPNIVQIYDSGEAEDLVYYVMPYIEGETLRQRLEREDQLPIDDALQITREVASALQKAHEAGIVHRDVKPANIMLSEDRVLVTDFGIARALATAGGETLTGTGIALGSAQYMSPEQASASDHLDARSDQYALACVLFEMLIGEPPFTGRTVQAILARQAVETVPGLRLLRDTIPASVEIAVRRSLSKIPADRFESVQEFVAALDAPVAEGILTRRPRLPALPWIAALAVVAVVASVWIGSRLGGAGGTAPVAEAIEAGIPRPLLVAPIDVVGASSASVGRENLTRMLADAVSGEGGIAVVPADSTLAWWRALDDSPSTGLGEQLRGAAELGAASILRASLLQTASGWRLTAVVVDAPSGAERFRVPNLTASEASLAQLVEELARHVLIRDADEERHLGTLVRQDLVSLRAYVGGLRSYRNGQYDEAVESLQRALRLDSAFVLAAIELAAAAYSDDNLRVEQEALAVAWANRRGLTPADSSFLRALAGTEYPYFTPHRQYISTWERVAFLATSRWESPLHLGARLYESGVLLTLDVPFQRAKAAFRRVRQEHPQFAPALEYGMQLAAVERDTAELTRLVETYLDSAIERDRSDFVRWLAATFTLEGHERDLDALLRGMDDQSLSRVRAHAQITGSGIEWAELAARLIEERAVDRIALWLAITRRRSLALNLGRPDQAKAILASSPVTLPAEALWRVIEAMYWGGDTSEASLSVQGRLPLPPALPPLRAGPAQADSLESRLGHLMDVCTKGLWGLHEGNLELAREMSERLIPTPVARQKVMYHFVLYCRRLLDAEVSAALGESDASEKADELEQLLLEGLPSNPRVHLAATLSLVRVREKTGDDHAALAAVRRRSTTYSPWGFVGLSSLLREEGRLADAVGDRDGAIKAYRHYLALRYDPEPSLEPEVSAIRARLAELEQSVPDQ